MLCSEKEDAVAARRDDLLREQTCEIDKVGEFNLGRFEDAFVRAELGCGTDTHSLDQLPVTFWRSTGSELAFKIRGARCYAFVLTSRILIIFVSFCLFNMGLCHRPLMADSYFPVAGREIPHFNTSLPCI